MKQQKHVHTQPHRHHQHHHLALQHQPQHKQYHAVTGKRSNFVNDTSIKDDEECQYDCYEMATMSNGQHCPVRRKSFVAIHCLQTSLTGSSGVTATATATTTTSKKPLSIVCTQKGCGRIIDGSVNGSGSTHVNHCKCQCLKKSKSKSKKLQFSKKKIKTHQQTDTLYLPTMCEGV